MTKLATAAATALLLVASAASASSLKEKLQDAAQSVKSAAQKAGSAIEGAAKSTADTASSVAFSVKSIANAALYGLPHFDKSVKTAGLDTPELRSQCPGGAERVNGCSVPLYDLITKDYKKIFLAACNDHDLCYLLSDAKQACDVAFRDRMYKICDGLSVKKSYGLCKTTAHTWFAAVAHAKLAVKLHAQEREWARANCKPVPELAKGPLVGAPAK